MCGIFSISGENVNVLPKGRIEAAAASLSHRGPDDRGILAFPGCILGHTRLSIIDLSGGHQPMQDAHLAISFNGEIYNYKELRGTLEKKGHSFLTNSDTEVILKAYKEYGVGAPEYLDGMFAFVIWDDAKKELFMARDRFGKKPLYYAYNKRGVLVAASEIKALFALGVAGELDLAALDNYLTLMYVPPHKTIYKNVFTLRPAEYATAKNGSIKKTDYWKLTRAPLTIGYGEAKEEIGRLLAASVRKRLVADVEVGSFLSGGVDSTLVSWYAQKFMNRPLKTFSLGYGEFINELPYAREASERIGTEHRTLTAGDDIVEGVRSVMAYFDEPHADSSDYPQSILSKLTKSEVKVALSGDGADELFMGYGWYQKHLHLPFSERLMQNLFSNPFRGYLKNISVFDTAARKELWKDKPPVNEDIFTKRPAGNSVDQINDFDLTTYLPGQLLTKIDRMGMMHGLEVRSPFLDREFAEFVYNLPTSYKMSRTDNKIMLKDILSELMPKDFVRRRKQGFGAPITAWLAMAAVKTSVMDTVGAPSNELYRFFNHEPAKCLLERFYEKGDRAAAYPLWVLFCLALWLETHPT